MWTLAKSRHRSEAQGTPSQACSMHRPFAPSCKGDGWPSSSGQDRLRKHRQHPAVFSGDRNKFPHGACSRLAIGEFPAGLGGAFAKGLALRANPRRLLNFHAGPEPWWLRAAMDTLGIEPRASRMLSGCDTTTPCAPCSQGTTCNNSPPLWHRFGGDAHAEEDVGWGCVVLLMCIG